MAVIVNRTWTKCKALAETTKAPPGSKPGSGGGTTRKLSCGSKGILKRVVGLLLVLLLLPAVAAAVNPRPVSERMERCPQCARAARVPPHPGGWRWRTARVGCMNLRSWEFGVG